MNELNFETLTKIPDTWCWVVTLSKEEPLKLVNFKDCEDAAEFLKDLPEGTQGAGIYGTRLFVTSGKYRFLQVPGRPEIALFNLPELVPGIPDHGLNLGFETEDEWPSDDDYSKAVSVNKAPVVKVEEEGLNEDA